MTDTSGSSIGWTHESVSYNNKAGFGEYFTSCTRPNDKLKTRGPIVIELTQSFAQLPKNSLNNSIVVHLGFGTELIDVGGQKQGSSWVLGGTEIPEFPMIVLPVAAVLGLVFILGTRRKE